MFIGIGGDTIWGLMVIHLILEVIHLDIGGDTFDIGGDTFGYWW